MVGDCRMSCYTENEKNYHSTLFVKEGKMPYQCGLEMDEATDNGISRIPYKYGHFEGFQVYM